MPFYTVPGDKICDAYHAHCVAERKADAAGNSRLALMEMGYQHGMLELADILYGSVYCGHMIMESDLRFMAEEQQTGTAGGDDTQ